MCDKYSNKLTTAVLYGMNSDVDVNTKQADFIPITPESEESPEIIPEIRYGFIPVMDTEITAMSDIPETQLLQLKNISVDTYENFCMTNNAPYQLMVILVPEGFEVLVDNNLGESTQFTSSVTAANGEKCMLGEATYYMYGQYVQSIGSYYMDIKRKNT